MSTQITVKGLREERAKLIHDARQIHEQATKEVRSLTAEERQKIDRILGYVDGDGNPTTQQQRQRGLDLTVAGRTAQPAEGEKVA